MDLRSVAAIIEKDDDWHIACCPEIPRATAAAA